jgi:hypothetical protein
MQVPSSGPSSSGTSPSTTISHNFTVDLFDSQAPGYPTPPLWRTGSRLSNRELPKNWCCYMHTPMSVRSMGWTSSGHPRPGSGGPTEPLRHRRLRIAGSGPHAPRHTAGRRTRMGLRAMSGPRELRADARPRGATGCTTLWAEGAVFGPRAELDV